MAHIDNNFFRQRRLVTESVVVEPLVVRWGDQLVATDKLETLVAISSIKSVTHRHQGFEQKASSGWVQHY